MTGADFKKTDDSGCDDEGQIHRFRGRYAAGDSRADCRDGNDVGAGSGAGRILVGSAGGEGGVETSEQEQRQEWAEFVAAAQAEESEWDEGGEGRGHPPVAQSARHEMGHPAWWMPHPAQNLDWSFCRTA